jgi:SAM-dependent methyltransferase
MVKGEVESRVVAGERLQGEFFKEYTSPEAISKYTRATAGVGISHLLDHDYKSVYLAALALLPAPTTGNGIRMLEFGCGGGMNLVHLVSILSREGIRIEEAVGTDFSPVLIEAAKRDARNCLREDELRRIGFHVARNETLASDLAASLQVDQPRLKGTFDFIFGVNTIRYCHAAGKELDCARDIFSLLAPGGVCVVIDMNNRFPFFRSDLRNRLRRQKEEECYVPSLEEYAAPFVTAGFELVRKEHFCWVPHSSGKVLCSVLSRMSPLLDLVARDRAMRSLIVARKPR